MITPKKTIIVPTGPAGKKESPFVTGILLNFNHEKRGGLAVEILLVMEKKGGRSYQRIPLAGPVGVSSMMNSTSAAAPEGMFSHSRGGLVSAPSQVYCAGMAPLRSNAGLAIAIAPSTGGGNSPEGSA